MNPTKPQHQQVPQNLISSSATTLLNPPISSPTPPQSPLDDSYPDSATRYVSNIPGAPARAQAANLSPMPVVQPASVPSTTSGRIPDPYSQSPEQLVDHRGIPLSDIAMQVAREYWECQREYEHCPLDSRDVQGPRPLIDPLVRMARHRWTYTQLVLGLDDLQPGMRTYEPPYIPPLGQEPPYIPPIGQEPPIEPNPAEPVLTPEQQRVVDLAASGKNIFYTGSAGCGKSTVLHAIRRRLELMGKRVAMMAPTGKVALAINGTTTWTFAGWNPDAYKRGLEGLEKMAMAKTTRQRFRRTDVIIVDEISMVENLHLERLNAVMKVGRYSADNHRCGVEEDRRLQPFGGVQVIFTGDFCQLPPVRPFQYCMYCGNEFITAKDNYEIIYRCKGCDNLTYRDSDKWAFKSDAWQECNFEHILLNTIHRQHDMEFITMLQNCRLGIPFSPQQIDRLLNHKSITANAVKLFSTREEVRRTNDEAFRRLQTPAKPYQCYDQFIWHEGSGPHLKYKGERFPDGSLQALGEHRLDRRIELKTGMLVVLLVNLDLAEGFCNGSQGIIAGFEPYDPDKLPRRSDMVADKHYESYQGIKEHHIKSFAESQKDDLGWPIVKFLNGKTRVIYPECQINEIGDHKPYSLLCRTQVPLTAAWALSIHKSQGMTLNRVIVNLSRAFEEGQVYVALSRATSLEGLKVEGDSNGLMVGTGGNQTVREFLWEKFRV